MKHRPNRRRFIQTTAAIGAGYWAAGGVSPKPSRAAIEEIRFACIGVDGKGSSDSSDAARNGKVVAICDIDDLHLEKRTSGENNDFQDAKKFNDFRKMLEEMDDSIDAVTVSTPDHTHAPAAVMAMRMGKHCFTQKPMTHSIYEARVMSEIAKENGLATQMGNQGTADSNLRRSAALVQGGAIGDVKEVHVWTNRPVWPQGEGFPMGQPAPPNVHWDLWIGPARSCEYSPEIHPFKWRGYWDFGTGALGDMACHTLNMSFMALDLRDPVSVQAETSGHNRQSYPGWSKITFDFPERNGRPPVKMYWYDGGQKPSSELIGDLPGDPSKNDKPYTSAALLVGEKGNLYSPGDYGGDQRNTGIMVDGEFTNIRAIREPMVDYTRSPGHFVEFANAIRGEGPAVSNFDNYAGPLTETVLLGNLAVWVDGPKVEWDAKNMSARINGQDAGDDVKAIIKPEYLHGYVL